METTKCQAVRMEVKKQDLKRMVLKADQTAKASVLAQATKAVVSLIKARASTTKINQT
jgi:hypothetical protein